jgi:hypothetical protein
MPIHACEHSMFAIGRRAPRRTYVGVEVARRPRADCRHGPSEAFSGPLTYLFGLCPVVLHDGALL